mmetsp:Transcript_47356/g.107452  ORF Transcript_47356/g.107452 Transcript_47356/m.107452 type:complete len:260 (-) Transcript_47356:503-1282(-)
MTIRTATLVPRGPPAAPRRWWRRWPFGGGLATRASGLSPFCTRFAGHGAQSLRLLLIDVTVFRIAPTMISASLFRTPKRAIHGRATLTGFAIASALPATLALHPPPSSTSCPEHLPATATLQRCFRRRQRVVAARLRPPSSAKQPVPFHAATAPTLAATTSPACQHQCWPIFALVLASPPPAAQPPAASRQPGFPAAPALLASRPAKQLHPRCATPATIQSVPQNELQATWSAPAPDGGPHAPAPVYCRPGDVHFVQCL